MFINKYAEETDTFNFLIRTAV